MGIRETLNENPRLTTGITIGIIVVVLLFIVYQMYSSSSTAGPNSTFQYYFTDDDGKTWFPDDSKKVPPFDHNGKEAVRALVYKCDGKTFVNHLERYTPDAKKKLEAITTTKAPTIADPIAADNIQTTGREVKKPGDKDWTQASDQAKFNEIIRPNCKNMDTFEMVMPQ